MREPTVVILGAGPTGLGSGLGLALNGFKGSVILIEKNEKPGGLAGSFKWKNHTIDYGPHRLSPNLDSVRVLAEEVLGPDCLVKKSQHGVQFAGKLYQFPPRVIDFLSPWSLWHLFAFALSFFVAKLSWFTWRFRTDTFESTIVRKFGRRFFKRVAAPMAEKVWVHPDCIDPNFVHQRFPSILPKEVLKRLIFPKQELNPSAFYYPRLGYQQLWDNIARMVTREGQRLIYSSEPVRIDVENNQIVRVVVKTPQGENEFESDDFYVVSTIPITTLVRLLPGGFESLRERVKSIKTRSMVLAVFELNEPRALPFRVLIYPEQRYCFNRLYEQNEYSRETIEKGKSVIVADITVPRGDKLMSAPDDEILARVKTDISKLGYVRVKNICDSCVRRVEYAYVVPDIETRKAFFEISHELKAISNCTLMGRFGIGEYDNSDYAIDAGLTLGGYLTRRISKLEYLRQSYQKRSRYIVG